MKKEYVSPWYNRNGWLGVKHQVTYLLVLLGWGEGGGGVIYADSVSVMEKRTDGQFVLQPSVVTFMEPCNPTV